VKGGNIPQVQAYSDLRSGRGGFGLAFGTRQLHAISTVPKILRTYRLT